MAIKNLRAHAGEFAAERNAQIQLATNLDAADRKPTSARSDVEGRHRGRPQGYRAIMALAMSSRQEGSPQRSRLRP